MKLVENNPYRIAGILSNATARELQSRKGKIQAFARVGKEITSEYDFSFLKEMNRNEAIITKAFSDIEQNQDKVFYSLFWFNNINSIDNTAIQHLKAGNKENAIEIWNKITQDKEVTPQNFSAFNNLGTIYLESELEEEIRFGIETKIKLIQSDNFKNFVNTVADETFIINQNNQVELFVDALLSEFKNKYSTTETIALFNNGDESVQKYLSKKFTEEPIHQIEKEIEQTKNKRIKEKSKAYSFATNLHKNTKGELALIKSILGIDNMQYKRLSDTVAKEILQCSIDYFNESQKLEKSNLTIPQEHSKYTGGSSNYLEKAMQLAKLAETIAINKLTKDRITDNINTLEGMKDKELSEAIELLNSIKGMYEENKNQILLDVKKQELTLSYNQSINWNNVSKMVENSINWDKAIELVFEKIPQKSIEKIKISEKQSKIGEFKSLVDFLQSKLSSSQKKQIHYLKYWEEENTNSTSKSNTISAKLELSQKSVTYIQALKNIEKKDILDFFTGLLLGPFIVAFYGIIPWIIISKFSEFTFRESLKYGLYLDISLTILLLFFTAITMIRKKIK